MDKPVTGNIFSIERCALHDGDGIRTIVYLKGCPLRCLWCANPEGQESGSELAFFPDRCIGCMKCLDACPQSANRLSVTGVEHDRIRCIGCGRCVEVCCADARRLWGRPVDVEEVMAEVRKDLAFYHNSGGGLTVSGGEPLLQAVFVGKLLQACHQVGIHTALETCGHAPWSAFQIALPFLDQLIYDIKHLSPDRHRHLTGVPNGAILENARRLAGTGVPMVIRVPFVPGHNDSEENLRRTAEFVRGLPGRPPLQVLPYHSYGSAKYSRLGRRYPMPDLEPPTLEEMGPWRDYLRACGIDCEIS